MIFFEGNDSSQGYGFPDGVAAKDPSRYGIVADPLGVYDRVWHVQVRPGDNNVQGSGNGERCEGLVTAGTAGAAVKGVEGRSLFFGWDVVYGQGFAPSSSDWNDTAQWHNSGTTGATCAIHSHSNVVDLVVAANDDSIWATERNNLVPDRQNMRRYEIVVQWVWSEDPAKGAVAAWVDGVNVVPFRHTKTLFKGQTTYPKLGYYREAQSTVADLYYHGYRITDSLADAAAAFTKSAHLDAWAAATGTTPPPPPPPVVDHIAAARKEFAATTITYPDWKHRVDTGYYTDRHIDPVSGTSWGRGFAHLDAA